MDGAVDGDGLLAMPSSGVMRSSGPAGGAIARCRDDTARQRRAKCVSKYEVRSPLPLSPPAPSVEGPCSETPSVVGRALVSDQPFERSLDLPDDPRALSTSVFYLIISDTRS